MPIGSVLAEPFDDARPPAGRSVGARGVVTPAEIVTPAAAQGKMGRIVETVNSGVGSKDPMLVETLTHSFSGMT